MVTKTPRYGPRSFEDVKTKNHLIGVLNEKSLHSQLKEWYFRPGDRFEGIIDGFHIDIVRNKLLIEIQTQNFSIEVLITLEEEIRRDDGLGSWRRRGWSIADRRLLEVVNRHIFEKPSDFLTLIPPTLPDPFSTKELAECTNQPRWLTQKMAYCLRKMGVVKAVGKNGNSVLYTKHISLESS